MSITTASRAVQLVSRVFDVRTSTEPFLSTRIEKTALPIRPSAKPLPRATPESQGIPSHHIQTFLEAMGQNEDLGTQEVLILRNGRLLAAASYGGQLLDAPKYTFSACKSIVSLAIGLLVDDGILALDEKLTDIFSDLSGKVSWLRLKDMTVEHLLTMEAGVLFAEGEAMVEADWIRSFLNSPISGDPGEEFFYNSLNTHMLAAIVRRKTGKPMLELLKTRLFDPMGITDILWEKAPDGIEKGGWGLYIRPEDMAKLGQLVMDNGIYEGQQLISSAYLESATTPHAHPAPEMGDFNYGYQIWIGRRENTFLFNGMLGQNIYGFRDSGVLLVTHAGLNSDFQQSHYYEMASRWFGGHFPQELPPDEAAFDALQEAIHGFSDYSREALPLDDHALPFLDRSFTPIQDHAASVGLLPVALQALYNCYTQGVTSIAVSSRGGEPELIYQEKDAIYRFPVGLDRPKLVELDVRGNVFTVAAQGRFTHDEDLRPVFVVKLEFLETPCTRILKLVLTGDGLLLREREIPGVPYVYQKLCDVAQSALYRTLMSKALGGTDRDFLMFKTLQLLSPDLRFKCSD